MCNPKTLQTSFMDGPYYLPYFAAPSPPADSRAIYSSFLRILKKSIPLLYCLSFAAIAIQVSLNQRARRLSRPPDHVRRYILLFNEQDVREQRGGGH